MKVNPPPMNASTQSLPRRLAEHLLTGLAVGAGLVVSLAVGVTALAHLA